MSDGARKPRSRWPGMSYLRRLENRRHRQATRRALTRDNPEAVPKPRSSSAKWMVW